MSNNKQDIYPSPRLGGNAPPQYGYSSAKTDQGIGSIGMTSVAPAPVAGVYPSIQQPIPTPLFGPKPVLATCPSCREQHMSVIKYEPNMKTHIIATILCVFTCCCCCIPYLVDSCKNANHLCPHCGAYLGTYAN